MLAVGGALVPVGMVAAAYAIGDLSTSVRLIEGGAIVGTVTPALGHWYAGKALSIGDGLRAGGFAFRYAIPRRKRCGPGGSR